MKKIIFFNVLCIYFYKGELPELNSFELYDEKGKYFDTCFESSEIKKDINSIYEKEIFIKISEGVFVSEEINKEKIYNLIQSDLFDGWEEIQKKIEKQK